VFRVYKADGLGDVYIRGSEPCHSVAVKVNAVLSNNKYSIMFSKIRQLLSKVKKDRPAGKVDSEMHESQADLSENLMWSLGLAMKVGLRVYIEVRVGTRRHGISVQGKDDPTLQYLYDLANAQWKVSTEDALGAKSGDS
jgi:hypothetical protein